MTKKQAIAEFKDRLRISAMNKYADLIPEYIEAMQLAISALEKQEQDRWISVTERLPEYEKEVLTCDDSGGMSVGYLYSPGFGHADRWHVDFTYSPVYHIVAWRPLPEPYTEEEA